MTADLRAALRDAAALLREDARDHIDDARKQAAAPLLQMAERLVALADAPPTVAELLPLVDATHEVHWNDGRRRAALVVDLVGVEMRVVGRWEMSNLYAADLTQPATLVEVTP